MKSRPARVIEASAASGLAQRGGKTLVLTNGVFDLLHPGHLAFLQDCAELGDLLAVGVNVDETVRRLKGPGRPVQGIEERTAALAAVRWVDFVIPFPEPTAEALIRNLRPDIYAKGVEYDPTGIDRRPLPELAGARDVGACCRFIRMRDGHSTTELAARVAASHRGPR
ncbi:MAG: adenylyltransferase/cytidyltransferase family protein [Chloroflexota bacterium]|nr:adenylyltransferase/cytidyltransferase family protein [Chloroflexota bacterium]